MAKALAAYVCQECGAVYKKWQGKCDECNAWNCIIEEKTTAAFSKISAIGGTTKTGKKLERSEINFAPLSGQSEKEERKTTSIEELDRVLGGGLVQGSAILIGGDPGIGKSTILLQLAASIGKNGGTCSYITGEESIDQIRMRAKRLGLGDATVNLAAATNVADIIKGFAKETLPDVIIIDSIQTMFVDEVESAPGTVTQVRTSAHELISFAKKSGATVILVGHVTKDGQIAGPKVLEHMVDTVLYFEGERGHQFRLLRAVKNRYGPANEIGVFEMTEKGLSEVTNPSSLFFSENSGRVSGSAIFAGIEGTRPLLVEIQALVSPSPLATPRRAVVGWDINRLAMIIAVLGTRSGIQLYDKEIYLNVAGGLKVGEPAADLAVAAAIVSSLTNIPLPDKTVFFGEVALSGEVRKVSQPLLRIREAEKLGFKAAISGNDFKETNKNFILEKINHINELKKIIGK